MQAIRSRKNSRDLGLAEQPVPRKRLKTEDSSEMENGDTYMNGNGNVVDGHVSHPEFLGARGIVNREEYIRLLAQALYGLNFRSAAKDLEAASGIDCEPAEVRSFRHAVLEGSWDRAAKLLNDLSFDGETAHKKAKFMVLTEKYLEVHILPSLAPLTLPCGAETPAKPTAKSCFCRLWLRATPTRQ